MRFLVAFLAAAMLVPGAARAVQIDALSPASHLGIARGGVQEDALEITFTVAGTGDDVVLDLAPSYCALVEGRASWRRRRRRAPRRRR